MRPDILLAIALGLPASLLIFAALSRRLNAHVKGLREKISFFFWPYPPTRMLVVQELDGEISIFYDDDYSEIRSENRTLIRTERGDLYVTEIPPSQAGIVISMYDAKAPGYLPSPFGIAWRWVVSASIFIYFLYYALVTALIPPIDLEVVEIGGRLVQIARRGSIDPWETLITMVAFTTGLTWLLTNVVRMNDRTILYAWYHGKGINPPHQAIIPTPGMSSISLLEYLERLGREIQIIVPQDLSDIYGELKQGTGSGSLAAVILAKLSMSRRWREALVRILVDVFEMWKAGEASAMMRLGFQPLVRVTIPVFIIGLFIGLVIGYVIGSVFTVSIAPANMTAITPAAPATPIPTPLPTPAPQPQPPTNTTPLPYTPAQPPPPPGVS